MVERRPHVVVVTLLGLMLGGVALRFHSASSQSYWYDEAVTVWLLREPLDLMLRTVASTENTPHLYYVLAWGWVRAFGDAELALRSLSIALGTAAIPLTFLAGRALVSRATGLVAAGLVATSPMLVWYSQEARAYSLLLVLGTTSVWLFARVRESATAPRLAAWSIVASITVCAHYYAVFLIAAEGALLLWQVRPRGRQLWGALAAPAVIVASLLPLAAHQQAQGRGAWIANRSIDGRLEAAAARILAGRQGVPQAWVIGVILAVAAFVLLLRYGRERERRGATTAALLALGAVGIPLAIAITERIRDVPVLSDTWLARNVICIVPLIAIILGAALTAPRLRALGSAGAAGLIAASLAATLSVNTSPSLQRVNWRGLAPALRSAEAVMVMPGYNQTVVRLYDAELQGVSGIVDVRSVAVVAPLRWEESVLCVDAPDPRMCFSPPTGAASTMVTIGDFRVHRFEWEQPVSISGAFSTTNRLSAGDGPAILVRRRD